MTPELRPLWCAASVASFSTRVSDRPGRAWSTARAVASPMMPPPTTSTSVRSIGRPYSAARAAPGSACRAGGSARLRVAQRPRHVGHAAQVAVAVLHLGDREVLGADAARVDGRHVVLEPVAGER